jgi:hypothetical protein
MTVVVSIALAAVVGGVVFMLLDNWQRRAASPGAAETTRRPAEHSGPLFANALSAPPPALGRTQERTQPLPPRGLWDDPPRRDDDDEDRPPGLWSGWASR